MSIENKKILIIEDDAFFADLVTKKLGKIGAIMVHAGSGEEGLTMAESEKPNLILLDVLLPGIDGFETLKRLKANDKTKMIPVVILSNFGSDDQIKQGQKLGVTTYLIKATVTPEDIIKEAESILK
ncbi:MAG: response regulator [Candidatus Pacebacteria bacterium]|nr:response regulator [Candidatus Paceibacterota bacterium]